MKIGITFFISCLLIYGYSTSSSAKTALSYGTGHGTKQVQAKRLNIQRAWKQPFVTANNSSFDGYWELGFSKFYIKRPVSKEINKQIHSVTASATLRLYKRLIYPMYLDLGIGVARLSKQTIAGRDLGSRLLFEDRLGCGFLFGLKRELELGYRVVHFSNAYLAKKNQGLNLHLLIVGYWFY